MQPRLGVSYAIPGSNTVLRASYGRTLETPYNENLLLSSGLGLNGVFGEGQILVPGKRNQGEFGIQQAFGGWVVADFGYFVKRTHNALRLRRALRYADRVSHLLGPLEDRRLHGQGQSHRTPRVQRIRGDGAHERNLFASGEWRDPRREPGDADFRIDHDQKFNSTTNLQYTFIKPIGAWAALNWRYDSGLVAGAVGSIEDALALTGDQQAAIGFFCGSTVATRDQPITDCLGWRRHAPANPGGGDRGRCGKSAPNRPATPRRFDVWRG